MLKCDFADPFFIVGTDFPAARVFDTTTSALAAVVELPARSRNVSLAALTLTSVAIQRVADPADDSVAAAGNRRHRTEQLVDDHVAPYYAAVGLSNGALLLHDVRRDALLAHVQVSEAQQPLISLQLCGSFAFCLAANSTLYVVRLRDASAGPCLRLRVQPDASSVAVTAVEGRSGSAAATAAGQTYRVMLAGLTNALYEVCTTAHTAMPDASQLHATKLLAFPSQGTAAEFAWVSSTAVKSNGGGVGEEGIASLPAITASAQDGVVRLWDLQYDSVSATGAVAGMATSTTAATANGVLARCRRTLLCGQRILNVSVLPSVPGTRRGNFITVTTLTGSVLLWSLGEVLLPSVVEPMPLKPDVVLVSASPSGRLLFGALRPAQRGVDGTSATSTSASTAAASSSSSADALRGLEMTLLRGRFAMPIFETTNIGAAVAASSGSATSASSPPPAAAASHQSSNAARRTALATLALGVAGSGAVTVVELPLDASTSASASAEQRHDIDDLLARTTDAATSSFVVMDAVWAAHQQHVAAKASQSLSEAFKAPQLYHAKSIQDLPVKQLTLEQRLQQIAREEAAAIRRRKHVAANDAESPVQAEDNDSRGVLPHHALGLATIPLYQALHANDMSAVVDLLNMSSRSAEGMRTTVLSLQLPYCLQLLQVLSERLGLVSKAVEKAASSPSSIAAAVQNGANGQQDDDAQGSSKDTAGAEKALGDVADGGHDENAANTSKDAVLRGGVAAVSLRSSLLEWIDAIVNYRGTELLAVQRDWNARAARKAAGTSTAEDDAADAVSPPRDFLAPILHHYQALCSQYDKLAVLYGRLSIFKSVRPSQKNEFTNVPRQSLVSNVEMARPSRAQPDGPLATSSGGAPHTRRLHLALRSSVVDNDIIFPVMFKEFRARSGHRVVRVRSRLAVEKKRREQENKNAALQQRARIIAARALREQAAKGSRSILDDDDSALKKGSGGGKLDVMDQIMMEEMDNGDGEVDLDALEAMDLAEKSDVEESSGDEEDEESEEREEEEEEGDGAFHRRSKKARAEVADAMIADAGESEGEGNDDDADTGLDSSEAEFSSASDDEVRSDVTDDSFAEEDEEDDDEEDEEASGSEDDAGSQYSDNDGDGEGSDDEDGMGEDMRELLRRDDDEQDRTERRKAKKVRID